MEEQLVCNRCGRKFTQNSSLRQHERDKHNLERCKVCGKSFDRKKALRNHLWFNHRNGGKRRVKKKKIEYNPSRQYKELSEEEKQKLREELEANAFIIEPKVYTDEERRELLRDWRELGK